MKKRALILAATTAATVAGSTAFAQTMDADSEDRCSEATMSEENDCDISRQSEENVDWEAKKIEMLKKQSEMRAEALKRAKEAGIDVSNVSSDLLDATETSESDFWDAMKAAKKVHEAIGLKKKVEELESKGYAVPDEVKKYASEGDYSNFWPAVKRIVEKKNEDAKPPKYEKRDRMEKNGSDDRREMKPRTGNRQEKTGTGEMRANGGSQESAANRKPALSQKTRGALVAKLDALPSDKKDAFYEKAKPLLESKIEKAVAAGQTKVARMLEEILRIVEERVGPDAQTEDAVIDELFQ